MTEYLQAFAAVISTLKTAKDAAKALGEIKSANADEKIQIATSKLRELLLDAEEKALDLREKFLAVREENAELKEKLAGLNKELEELRTQKEKSFKQAITQDDYGVWRDEAGHIFCPKCKIEAESAVRMVKSAYSALNCPACNYDYEPPRQPNGNCESGQGRISR